jgi:hypothetical protein
LLAEDERLKAACGMVNTMVVVLVAAPEVPLTVTGYVPEAAVLLTLKVSEVELVLMVANAAVTPAGTPDAARLTLLTRPIGLMTLIAIGTFQPFWPAKSVRLLADDERAKLGVGIVRTMAAALFAAPEVPVTVTVYVPVTAVLLAVKVSVIALLALAMGQLSLAVTPVGTPETARFTLPLLRPAGLTTLIVLLALLPPTRRVRALGEEERVKLGCGMVKAMVVELVRVPEVPVTVTM